MKRLFRTAPKRTRWIPSVLLVGAWMLSPLSVHGKPEDRASAKAAPAQPRKAEDAPVKSPEPRPSEARASGAKSNEARRNSESASNAGSLPEASDEPSVDPRRGQGARSVVIEPSPRAGKDGTNAESGPSKPETKEAKETKAEAKETKAEPSAGPKAAKGKSNAKAPRSTPDMNQRRQIALGPTSEELALGKEDPELRSLRDAELVLFPQPLPGLVPGWSWDLPQPSDGLPEIVSGAPLPAPTMVLPKTSSGSPEWLRSMSMPNLPVRLEDRVVRYLTFFRDSPSGRSIARAWVKKSGRYIAALRAELARNGLPTDLAWLSLVESGFNPSIASPVGAAGLWQFTPDAGRTYGLYIDRWVDERLDPERSTTAACRYLSDLYRRFGTWELAMAAYNMGYAGLSRSIRKYNTNDFWELSRYEAGLPWETTLYVPKILATALVMTNKRTFSLDDIEIDRPERFDTVLVAPSVLLEDVARMAGVAVSIIETLNPQYLAGRTPPSTSGTGWPVRVPVGAAAAVRESLARGTASDHSLATYVVRAGDSIESIALAHGATEAQLRALNRIEARESLGVGSLLLVPKQESVRTEALDSVVVVPPREFNYPDRRRIFYRVMAGDTLGQIARTFRVTQADLETWNALDSGARLHSGMALQLYVNPSDKFPQVRHFAAEEARILVAGSDAFFDYFEGQNGRRRLVVRARSGDTLASIGKRYGMTIGWMERINRRFRTDPVLAAEPIVVYTERQQAAPGDNLYVDSPSRVASNARTEPRAGKTSSERAGASAPSLRDSTLAEPSIVEPSRGGPFDN